MSEVRSMTGFATVAGWAGDAPFTLTIKSVNHRFLDLQTRLPGGCDGLETSMRRMLKERLRRGHVEVAVSFERGAGGGLRLNKELLAEYVRLYREAMAAHGLAGEPELNGLLRMPGVLSAEAPLRLAEMEGFEAAVLAALDEAIARLNEARSEEGATLAMELERSMRRIHALAEEVGALRAGVRQAQFERLQLRMRELMAGVEVAEDRLLAEAALLAERSDVEEELVRVRTHAQRFLALLEAGGELGKRTDFLLQELNREANTPRSKTGAATGGAGLEVTEMGLEMKAEIERAREQVQNLE